LEKSPGVWPGLEMGFSLRTFNFAMEVLYMNQKSRQELSVQELSILRSLHRLDRKRHKLYHKRQELQRELEQVQAEKYRLKNPEVAENE